MVARVHPAETNELVTNSVPADHIEGLKLQLVGLEDLKNEALRQRDLAEAEQARTLQDLDSKERQVEALRAKAEADAKKLQQLEQELAAAKNENKELRSLSSTASLDCRERAAMAELLEKEGEEKRELLGQVASLKLKVEQLQEEKTGSNGFEDLMVEKFNYLSKERDLLHYRLRENEELHRAKLADLNNTVDLLQRDAVQLRQNNDMLRLHSAKLQAESHEAIDQLAQRLNSQFKVSLPVPSSIGIIFSGLDVIAMRIREFEQERPSEPRQSVHSIRSGQHGPPSAGRPKQSLDDKLIKDKVMLEIAVARSERDIEALKKRLAACTCHK